MSQYQKSVERRTKKSAEPPTEKQEDPFRLGWRFRTRIQEDGSEVIEQIPLTRWDVLHPQEDDFIVQNENHTRDCQYLKQVLQVYFKDKKDVLVLCDHRIDWQVPGIIPHGPDIVVLSELKKPWDPEKGTFPVADMGAKVLVAVEVVSQSTYETDYEEKVHEYFRSNIPYYLIVDARRIDRNEDKIVLLGFRATSKGYVAMKVEKGKGIWIPSVSLWFRNQDGELRCFDENDNLLPNLQELQDQKNMALEAAQAAKTRAEQAEQRIRELEAQLKKPNRRKK